MRLIDADELFNWGKYKLFDAVKYGNKDAGQQHFSYSTLMMYEIADEIEDAPTVDAVPVVRCSECISHGTLTNGNLFCGKRFTGVYGEYHVVKPDDYCSHGGRR